MVAAEAAYAAAQDDLDADVFTCAGAQETGATPDYALCPFGAGVTWTAETLDAWIANPRAIVPGTRMAYAGLEDPRDRVDVVAYLKTVTMPAPKQ